MQITKSKKSNIFSAVDSDTSTIPDDYMAKLRTSCGEKIQADSVSWDEDEDNLYLITSTDDVIVRYKIPMEDLSGDLDKDTKYILDAVVE